MIPYFPPPEFSIGPLRLHAFGLLVATGVLLGLLFCYRRAAEWRVPPREFRNAALWTLVPGFVGSALFSVLLYQPEALTRRGVVALVDFSQGMSSYGGFFCAAAGGAIFAWINKRSWIRMADIFVQGLTVGWIFGRLGCTVVHDHPGKLSDFFLAVNYPEGARHNLGLYEFLYTLLVLLPAILFVHRRVPYRPGIYVAIVSLLYGAVRFPLEFLRLPETDPRYGGLTFAQYSSLFLVGLGLWLLARPTKRSAANSRPDGI